PSATQASRTQPARAQASITTTRGVNRWSSSRNCVRAVVKVWKWHSPDWGSKAQATLLNLPRSMARMGGMAVGVGEVVGRVVVFMASSVGRVVMRMWQPSRYDTPTACMDSFADPPGGWATEGQKPWLDEADRSSPWAAAGS